MQALTKELELLSELERLKGEVEKSRIKIIKLRQYAVELDRMLITGEQK